MLAPPSSAGRGRGSAARRAAGRTERARAQARCPRARLDPRAPPMSIVSPSATKTTSSARLASEPENRSISPLYGMRASPRNRPAMKTARKPEPWASEVAPYSAPARTSASTGYRPSLGSRRRRSTGIRTSAPQQAERDTDRHLDRELAHDHQERSIVVGGELDHAEHERDPGRIVDARLALENRPRAPRHLAPAEHGEHDGRIGRRDQRLRRFRPASTRSPARSGRARRQGRQSRTCPAGRRRGSAQRRLETAASRCRCRR